MSFKTCSTISSNLCNSLRISLEVSLFLNFPLLLLDFMLESVLLLLLFPAETPFAVLFVRLSIAQRYEDKLYLMNERKFLVSFMLEGFLRIESSYVCVCFKFKEYNPLMILTQSSMICMPSSRFFMRALTYDHKDPSSVSDGFFQDCCCC